MYKLTSQERLRRITALLTHKDRHKAAKSLGITVCSLDCFFSEHNMPTKRALLLQAAGKTALEIAKLMKRRKNRNLKKTKPVKRMVRAYTPPPYAFAY